jgi:hypothetical protein
MGDLRETAASLGFFGDDLDPDEITRMLGREPTVGVRKGEVWKTSLGFEKIARTGSWRMEAERAQPGDLDGQIADILSCLSADASIWKALSSRFGGRVFCGLFMATYNDGVRLEPGTVAALGERGLAIDLDIYGPDDHDPETVLADA